MKKERSAIIFFLFSSLRLKLSALQSSAKAWSAVSIFILAREIRTPVYWRWLPGIRVIFFKNILRGKWLRIPIYRCWFCTTQKINLRGVRVIRPVSLWSVLWIYIRAVLTNQLHYKIPCFLKFCRFQFCKQNLPKYLSVPFRLCILWSN